MRRAQILADAIRLADAVIYDPTCDICTATVGHIPLEGHPPECALHVKDRIESLGDPSEIGAPAVARRTSVAAADLEQPRAGSQAEHVLDTIWFCYPVPMTDFEIYERRPPMVAQAAASTIRARRIGLMEAGWVMAVDEEGRSPKGRACIRWGLTPSAVERLR